MAEQRSKSNKKFMLLSAIGIFMVVDSHTWTAFNLFGDYIPYNSFFMPMFVLISGYFNKIDNNTKLLPYIWKKVKTLLFPYIGISVTVWIMQYLINWYKLGEVPEVPSGYLSYALQRMVTVGSSVSIAEPMWFVITLFALLLFYAVCKKFLYRIWNSYVMFAVFAGLHLLTVYLAKNSAPDSITYYLLPLKVMFFLPFLELGVIYREHLEKRHEAMSGGAKIGLMFLMLLINTVRIMILPNPYDAAFDDIGDLAGFTSPYIVTPMISSFVGIIFWLTFVDLISKPLGESRFINYMSCNTFWIMGLHIAFFNVLNCILMMINGYIVELPYFDNEAFWDSEWYRWEPVETFKMVYVAFGIFGPLLLKFIYDKVTSSAGRALKKQKA